MRVLFEGIILAVVGSIVTLYLTSSFVLALLVYVVVGTLGAIVMAIISCIFFYFEE